MKVGEPSGASSLRQDSRGVSAIELALVLPFLILMVCASVDVALGFSAKLKLEQAAQRATDFGLAKRPSTDDASALKTEAAAAAGVPTSSVAASIYLECGGTRQTVYTTQCPTGQVPSRVISVSISKQHTFLFDYGAIGAAIGYRPLPASSRITGDSLVRYE
jgi:Flp pilus assembly protein TadG